MLTPIAAYLYYDRQKQMNRQATAGISVSVSLVFLIIGIFAAYLSWTCNTKHAISTGSKIFYGFFAFFDNLTYILNYYIFRRNTSLTCA